MLFNSMDFLIFLPVVLVVFYICPPKIRYIWLLIASYYFYMSWNPVYILLLIGCTLITYFGALIIVSLKKDDKSAKRVCLGTCLLILLGVLAFFKYYDFILLNLNYILSLLKIVPIENHFSILLPVGISFYTLQAIGYLLDVYWGKIDAEKNLPMYALFLSFFPQLVAGPIERSQNLLNQLENPEKSSYEDFIRGCWLFIWGLFCKMVIADRIAIVIDTVYENYTQYNGVYIIYATILFSIQIYCDFYGYSTIARGVALMLGIRLVDNFDAPYMSCSVKEFWRRWHISLSFWFRDYLYIPLGGNRKGKIRKETNLLLVFCISGLWHGAAISFIIWGFLNGLYQVLGDITNEIKHKIIGQGQKSIITLSNRLLQWGMTFIMVSLAWLFFRAGSISTSFDMIKNINLTNWMVLFDGSLYNLGVKKGFMQETYVAIIFLGILDCFKYKKIDVIQLIERQGVWFKAFCFAMITILVLLFGCYGEVYDAQQFIYFQF